jgi:ATP-dependent DNA helicase RecG
MNIYNSGLKTGEEQESQTIEWKWAWHEDYLKWLCEYANTDGGV